MWSRRSERSLDSNDKTRGEGIVVSIDREKNWLWLRDVDEQNKLAPKSLRHIVPRYVDPLSPKRATVLTSQRFPALFTTRMLCSRFPARISMQYDFPAPQQSTTSARACMFGSAMQRSKRRTRSLSRQERHSRKSRSPWPSLPGKRRHRDNTMSDRNVVEGETWAPWRPEDPVLLPERKGNHFDPVGASCRHAHSSKNGA